MLLQSQDEVVCVMLVASSCIRFLHECILLGGSVKRTYSKFIASRLERFYMYLTSIYLRLKTAKYEEIELGLEIFLCSTGI